MLPKNFPYRKQLKREAGEKRQAEYDKLSIQEKLERLDRIFGAGLGATRQRARYAKLLAKPAPPPEPEAPLQEDKAEKSVKKTRAKNSSDTKKRAGKTPKNSAS